MPENPVTPQNIETGEVVTVTKTDSSNNQQFMAGLGFASGLVITPFLIIGILVVLCCVCFMCMTIFGSTLPSKSVDYTDLPTPTVSPTYYTEGMVISGLSRSEITREYTAKKLTSALAAKQYMQSIKGSKIVWIAKVGAIDSISKTVIISMIGENSLIHDKTGKYSDLRIGDLVQVTGVIGTYADLNQFVITIDDALLEQMNG